MKKIFMSLSALMAAVLLSVCFTSCGDDKDDGGGDDGSFSVKSLLGRSFKMQKKEGGAENIETKYYQIAFQSIHFVNVHIWGNGFAADEGNYKWDSGTADCDFKVSGNHMTIYFVGDHDYKETIELTFQNNKPVGWTETEPVQITDDGSEGTGAGSSEMFGYYSSDYFRSSVKQEAQDINGSNITAWNNLILSNLNNRLAYRIVDGSTLWRVFERIHFRQQDIDSKYDYVYQTESYRIDRSAVTLYYTLDKEPYETYRYVMKGTQLVVSGYDVKLEYRNGQLIENGSFTYTKK